jgi:hypothetical protein
MDYYRLHDKNSSDPDRWYLGAPAAMDGKEIEPDLFIEGKRISLPGPLSVSLVRPGPSRDFTLAHFEVPVLRLATAEKLEHLFPRDVQSIRCVVQDQDEAYSILNERRSTFARWPKDGVPSHLARKYQIVTKLRISHPAAEPHDLLRIDGWPAPLVVSERCREALFPSTGAYFEPV